MKKLVSSILKFIKRSKYRRAGVIIGKNTFISPKAYIDCHPGSKIIIGSNCYITRNVVILNHTDTYRGGPLGIWEDKGAHRVNKDVVIGDNVFIGVNSVILPGINIGNNAVIGALSLVNCDIPEGTVWAGVPVREITTTEDMIKKEFPSFKGL